MLDHVDTEGIKTQPLLRELQLDPLICQAEEGVGEGEGEEKAVCERQTWKQLYVESVCATWGRT